MNLLLKFQKLLPEMEAKGPRKMTFLVKQYDGTLDDSV